jgi:hypothetical protein
MTAAQLVATIKAAGGIVTLSPDGVHVRCRLPLGFDSLIEQLRQCRGEVLTLLIADRKDVVLPPKGELAGAVRRPHRSTQLLPIV